MVKIKLSAKIVRGPLLKATQHQITFSVNRGVKNNYILGIPNPILHVHCPTFMGATIPIKGHLQVTFSPLGGFQLKKQVWFWAKFGVITYVRAEKG